MNKIFVLNLNNNQKEYAMTLDFIKAIEDHNSGSIMDRKNTILKVLRKISIYVGNMQNNISPRYLEQPISVSGRGNISSETIQNKHLFTEMEFENLGRKDVNIKYHLRIHFEDSRNELIHLQYMAMLLKKVSNYFTNEKESKSEESEDKELKKYLTVFMVPTTGDIYPFKNKSGEIDYNTYINVSRYLRLLSKRYTGVIYGVDEVSNQPVVTSLDFRKNKKCETCFPLTIIDKNVYEFLFAISITDILDSLFSLKKNGRFGKSRDENPIIALKDYIAETDLYRIRSVASSEECSKILHFMKSQGNISLMEFSLFVFMLSMNKTEEGLYNEEKYADIWHLANEISQGLKQVAQNAIQHTESRECFFSFYLHEKENNEDSENFIDRIIKMYPNTNFNASDGESALEIFVSDLNDKEDMIDNFITNLEYERNIQVNGKFMDELSGHIKLIKCRDKLAIRNFFSVYALEDARSEWKYFRQEDLIAHIGLSQFALTAAKCKASVKVISSRYSELTDEKKFFYRSYSNTNALNSSWTHSQWENTFVIPGTQFSILIPVHHWSETDSMGIGQLKQQNCVAESYKSFASYLDCHEKRNTILLKESGINSRKTDILDAKRKYRLVQSWKTYWGNKFEENIKKIKADSNIGDRKGYARYVFNYDFNEVASSSYFNDEDRIEVCLKGIISALGLGENLEEPFLIALTNLPAGFIENLRKICVQLSVKRFPDEVQLFLHEKENGGEKSKRAVMLGNDFSQAICNAYILSMEHGVGGFDKNDCENAIEIKTTLTSGLDMEEEGNGHELTEVCPFDVILSCSEKEKKSFFEIQLKDMVEGALDEELIGYKLNDTHMRLGSKVHIESFYEMSFLFYRTTIANRLAFSILKQIKKEKNIDIVNDNVLFYGYASYSKAVLTSINEILREYRKIYLGNKECLQKDKIAIASFQHNLMLESEETQMYYDLPSENFPGSVGVDNHLRLQEMIKVIQIVPISSTLTTFGKMWRRFIGSVVEKDKNKICLAGNYTVFWVVDQKGDLKKGLPSEIEVKYWEKVVDEHKILTKVPVLTNTYNMDIHFFIRSAVVWHDPLKCELCYPKNVINEVPLVETDPTSTVPTQQIRYRGYQFTRKIAVSDVGHDRFAKLQNCVLYDHIGRRQNHYQFYIDTQQYFYNVKDMVKDWLEDLSSELLFETREPVLHIIFSPEHNTNVGFVQYVNTYYFNGMAEIVSINVDKQFRSNFICEHAALKRMIEELHRDRRDMKAQPVKFYFVDDTIITGDTLEKANGLIHSLVPSNEYPVNLFSKIFVLMDRLSDETKQMYVDNPKQNFVAFLHVDVSNVRTHGDSCIGCKLEQDALKLYKRSATRNMAQYWYQKLYDYRKKAYDNKKDIASINKDKSYQMLLFSHILQNVIVKQGRCYRLGDSFDVVLNLSLWLLNAKGYMSADIYGYNEFLGQMRNMNGVRVLLKTVCRPFFSYDFKIKRQLYTFFIFLTELMLGEKSGNIVPEELKKNRHISYLFENDRIPKMDELERNIRKSLSQRKESELDFLKDYLFEGLTDMESTYAMRMQTLKKVYAYIEDKGRYFSEEDKILFWNSYEVNIHRLVTGNADESRELWLEYMYMTGLEYVDFLSEHSGKKRLDYEPRFFYSAIAGVNLTSPREKHFYQFCHNLFLQNTGINFDELEEKSDTLQPHISVDGNFLRDYWRQMRNLDSFMNPLFDEGKQDECYTESERRLFDLLKSKDIEKMGQTVNQWYEDFLNEIVGVIGEKYNIEMKDINIAMLTETNGDKECENHIQLLDIIKENINSSKVGISETRYYIKERIVNALKDNGLFNLEQNGYTISEGSILKGERRPYIIAFIDNPGNAKKAIYERTLTRVFLYISISEGNEEQKMQLLLRLILRDVLMYRNRILRFLEKDFAGEIYASYAHKIGEKNILSHEKAHSHNTTADDEISLEIFQGIKTFKDGSDYKELDRGMASDWLLLRNYTNGQIAKIFNRSFHDSKDGQLVSNTPMLYIPKDSMNYGGNIFKQKLVRFSELNLRNENQDLSDERFRLLNKIIDIQYDEAMNDARFIQGSEGQFYNFEYFKCILIDIMISAIKFKSDRSNYLTRIDRFLEINRKLDHEVCKWNTDDKDIVELVNVLKESRCYIKIFRKKSPISEIDYLVIQNPVDKIANRLKNWEEQNQIILHRLEDPLDYADGHMSLLTIKRYIENLDETYRLRCVFQYKTFEVDGKEKLFFESRLPILKREVNK